MLITHTLDISEIDSQLCLILIPTACATSKNDGATFPLTPYHTSDPAPLPSRQFALRWNDPGEGLICLMALGDFGGSSNGVETVAEYPHGDPQVAVTYPNDHDCLFLTY